MGLKTRVAKWLARLGKGQVEIVADECGSVKTKLGAWFPSLSQTRVEVASKSHKHLTTLSDDYAVLVDGLTNDAKSDSTSISWPGTHERL